MKMALKWPAPDSLIKLALCVGSAFCRSGARIGPSKAALPLRRWRIMLNRIYSFDTYVKTNSR